MRILTSVFCGILCAGFVSALVALRPALANSPSLSEFKTRLAENLPFHKLGIVATQELRYKVLGGHDDQVRLGRDGWIYLTLELNSPDRKRNFDAHLKRIVHMRDQLQKEGTALVVVVVPAKYRIYPEFLPWTVQTEPLDFGYLALQDELKKHNILSLNLLDTFTKAKHTGLLYYKTDTHWNERGAKLAGQSVARLLRQNWPDLPVQTFETRPAAMPTERIGDLIRLMGLEDAPAAWRPQGDWEAKSETVALGQANMGLLDDETPAVVLVGSSYSLRGNFGGHLKQFARSDVINLAKEGSAFDGSLKQFLSSDHEAPKVLIWEFSERFLYLPEGSHS